MASMALVACGPSRRCIDPAGQVAPDSFCAGPVIRPGYHWVYSGSRATTGIRSTGVRSGSQPSSGVSRGGFGSTGSGHSSGASGHGSGS